MSDCFEIHTMIQKNQSQSPQFVTSALSDTSDWLRNQLTWQFTWRVRVLLERPRVQASARSHENLDTHFVTILQVGLPMSEFLIYALQ